MKPAFIHAKQRKMKFGPLIAMILGMMALANAAATPGKYSDVASMLHQNEEASNNNFAMKESVAEEDADDEDDDVVAQEVKNALSSIMQDDGEDGLLAAMMEEGDEDDAVAQLFRKFFKRVHKGLKKFRPRRRHRPRYRLPWLRRPWCRPRRRFGRK
jgi:hypothetical protein